ncbi:membrane protein [Paenibacillus chitinolyticus]|nr:membrane protein [Paenibacillus chitinolyticus]
MGSFEWDKIFLNMSLVLLLVLLNGFFVAAEFALVKVRQSKLQQLVNEGNKKAKFAYTVTKKLDAYLSATQLGITLASLGLGWVGESAIAELIIEPLFHALNWHSTFLSGTISLVLSFSIVTFLHIVLGELAPKSLAIQKPDAVSLWTSAPLMYFYKIFLPAIWVLNGAARLLLKMFGVQPANEHDAAHTEEEIRILMNQSAKSGHIDRDEMLLFDNIFEFSDRIAREVMLPRTDMDCLFIDQPYDEILQHIYETKHTRYPVALGDKDQIIGFVHITDLLTADATVQVELQQFVRPILSVPESMEISQVLKLMQKKHSQLAIVVDEYGGTAGMLALEDIMEEIVGELHDEFDEDERPSIEVKGNITSVEGRTLIEDLNVLLHLEIEDEEVDTIGGWVFKTLEGSPIKGKKVVFGGHTFEVAEVDRLRITRVNITKNESETPKDPAAGLEE